MVGSSERSWDEQTLRLQAVAVYLSLHNSTEHWPNVSTALCCNNVKVGWPLVKLANEMFWHPVDDYSSNEVSVLMKVRPVCPLTVRRSWDSWQHRPHSWSWHLITEQC